MDNSLNQIAEQILNGVYAGLKGPGNFSVSKQQIKDEVAQMRNRGAEELISAGLFESEPFRQTIHKLPVAKKDFSGISGYETNRQEYFASIPELLYLTGIKPVNYVAAMNKEFPFKVLYGDEFFYANQDRYSKSKPTIWVRDKELWLLNPPIANIQHITMRAMFENPRALNGVSGMRFTDDDPYPMQAALTAKIRNKLVEDYIRQYRMGTMQPTLMGGDINISPQTK